MIQEQCQKLNASWPTFHSDSLRMLPQTEPAGIHLTKGTLASFKEDCYQRLTAARKRRHQFCPKDRCSLPLLQPHLCFCHQTSTPHVLPQIKTQGVVSLGFQETTKKNTCKRNTTSGPLTNQRKEFYKV